MDSPKISTAPSGWWWLSFLGNDQALGPMFLGVAIVPGKDLAEAISNAWHAGCNPGGEVRGMSIIEGCLPAAPWRERLLSTGEALELKTWIEAPRSEASSAG